jgi:Protein of unknown function (DUF2637)
MSAGADRWIRWTTTGCVALLALIAGTVSYLHMHLLVELHGQPGWVVALTPLSVDGMIVVASTTLLADSCAGQRGGGAAVGASCRRQCGEPGRQRRGGPPTAAGRVIAAWPSFALIGAYELLMRQVRHGAAGGGKSRRERRPRQLSTRETSDSVAPRLRRHSSGTGGVAVGPGPVAVPVGTCIGRRGTGR